MIIKFSSDTEKWLCHSVGIAPETPKIIQMQGATSSSVFLVEFPSALTQKFVLRVLDNPNWLKEEPDVAQHEAAALSELSHSGILAPTLINYSNHEQGLNAPVVLMSFLQGQITLNFKNSKDRQPWLNSIATELFTIHQHLAPNFPWAYKSWLDKAKLTIPNWTSVPHIWKQAIEQVLEGPPPFNPVFIHRDFHPTNVLWHQGKISGVVDWINACLGPAGVDLAHCRTNLALMLGSHAAEEFLTAYQKVASSFQYHPYWDLESILDMCLPNPTFYKPWQEFGLDIIDNTTLQNRIDNHLENVMLKK